MAGPSLMDSVSWTCWCRPTRRPFTRAKDRNIPAVIIPVLTQHYAMLQRNLLYTGVTRGKRLVVLVGQRKAVAIAVRNASGRRRWSKLAEWLRPCSPLSRRIGVAGWAMVGEGFFEDPQILGWGKGVRPARAPNSFANS